MELSNSQYRILKELYHCDIELDLFTGDATEDIKPLITNGIVCEKTERSSNKIPRTFVHLTPYGRARYDTYKRNNRRWLISVTISIAAIIISIFALYKSSQPININISY